MRNLALSTQQKHIVLNAIREAGINVKTSSHHNFVDYNVHSNKVKIVLGGRAAGYEEYRDEYTKEFEVAQRVVLELSKREDVLDAYVDNFWCAPVILFKVPEDVVKARQQQRREQRKRLGLQKA